MYRAITTITITQRTQTKAYPLRNKVFTFNFAHEYECTDSWRDLTNHGKVVVPKNLYVRDANNKLVPLAGTIVNIGGFSANPPLIMRGDAITIDWAYKYFSNGREIQEGTNNTTDNTHLFQGFVSKVTSKKPIEFEIEDNMFLLKQIQAPIKTFLPTDTLETILTFLLQGTGLLVNTTAQTTFGAFMIGSETIAEVLSRLRKQYHFESYFRGNTLYCGALVYSSLVPNVRTFYFQSKYISGTIGAIASDELEYNRKDDIVLSATATNTIEEETGATTKDGQPKTKRTRLEVLVTFQNGSDTPTVLVKQKGVDYPANTGGERRTLFFPGATTIQQLKDLAADELRKYYYTGFKGKFTTFGLPFVRMGDNVNIMDNILPERNGLYKVKSVAYSGGVNGLRQVVELDYKILLTTPSTDN